MEVPGAKSDTPREIEERVIEGLRRLGPAGRARQTAALCLAADELATAGIRLRDGPLASAEVRTRLARLRYGDELALDSCL